MIDVREVQNVDTIGCQVYVVPQKRSFRINQLLTYYRFGHNNNMRTPNTPSFSEISQERDSLKCLSETHLLQVRYSFNFVERERERA